MTRIYVLSSAWGAFARMTIEADLRALHVPVEDLIPQRTAHQGYVFYDVPLTPAQYQQAHSIQVLEGRGEVLLDFTPGMFRKTPVASEVDLDTILVPVDEFKRRAAKDDVRLRDGYRGSRGVLEFSAFTAEASVDFHGFITPTAYAMDLRDAAYYRIPQTPSHRDVHLRGPGARSSSAVKARVLEILHGLTARPGETNSLVQQTISDIESTEHWLNANEWSKTYDGNGKFIGWKDPKSGEVVTTQEASWRQVWREGGEEPILWSDIDTPAKADFAALREEDRLNMMADDAGQWEELK